MKTFFLLFVGLLCHARLFAQSKIKDNAVTHQEERMVYRNWDQKKFDPTSGFLASIPFTGSCGASSTPTTIKPTFVP
jgi:hypothetical protein